jgi:hypothetical protein
MYISQWLTLGEGKLPTVRFWDEIFFLGKGRTEIVG